VALHDAASRGTLELNDIAFSGDVRALAGSIRGNGNFMVGGTRYPFRIASSRDDAGGGARLHLTLEPGLHGLTADLEGALRFEARAPRFEGTVVLARRRTDGTSAGFGDAVAAVGEAEGRSRQGVRWAARRQLRHRRGGAETDGPGGFSASRPQADGAGAVVRQATRRRQDAFEAERLRRAGADDAGPACAVVGIAAAAVADAGGHQRRAHHAWGRPVQDLDLTLRAAGGTWSVDRLEVRAPGATRGRHSRRDGRVIRWRRRRCVAGRRQFSRGRLTIDSAIPARSPDGCSDAPTWRRGRNGPLRIAGDVHLASDRIAIDDLKARCRRRHHHRAHRVGCAQDRPRLGVRRRFSPPTGSTSTRRRLSCAPSASRKPSGRIAARWRSTSRTRCCRAGVAAAHRRLGYDGDDRDARRAEDRQTNGSRSTAPASFIATRDRQADIASVRAVAGRIAGLIEPWSPSVAARLQARPRGRPGPRASSSMSISPPTPAMPARASAQAALRLDAPRIKGA